MCCYFCCDSGEGVDSARDGDLGDSEGGGGGMVGYFALLILSIQYSL